MNLGRVAVALSSAGVAALAMGGAAVAAPSPAAASAKVACSRFGVRFGSRVTVVASYPSTGRAIVAWSGQQLNPFSNDTRRPLTKAQQSTPVAACFLRGAFDAVPLAPGVRPYTNAVVSVAEASGHTLLISAGHGGTWGEAPPPPN